MNRFEKSLLAKHKEASDVNGDLDGLSVLLDESQDHAEHGILVCGAVHGM